MPLAAANIGPWRIGSREVARVPFEVIVEAQTIRRRLLVQILDLSNCGVRLRTPSPLEGELSIWLDLPMVERQEVEIVWSDRAVVGCRFPEPLPPAVLKIVVRALEHERRRQGRQMLSQP